MLKVICSSTDKTGSKISLLKKIIGQEVKFGAFVQTPEGDLDGEWTASREYAATQFENKRAPGAAISA